MTNTGTRLADLPIPATPAAEVRRIADDVLARAEFAEAQPGLWEQVLRWINDFLGRLFTAIGDGGRGSIIGMVTLLTLGGILAYVVVRGTRSLRSDPGMDAAMDVGIGRSPREWLAEANQHEAEGRWRDAIRCRYRALLADLAAAGLVDEVAGRTSGEYLAAVRDDVPRAAEAFEDVTRRFELAWYGHEPATADDVHAFNDAAGRAAAGAGLRRALVSA